MYLLDHDVFLKDQRDLTKDDLISEFDGILKSLDGTPLDGNQLSWQQRLVVLCFGFDINPPAPEFPNEWCELGEDDLDELARLLSNSPIFEAGGGIDHNCVATWLKDLDPVFCSLPMQP